MNRKERQTQIIEKQKKKERVEKAREKRWSKRDLVNEMNNFLASAKTILGIF